MRPLQQIETPVQTQLELPKTVQSMCPECDSFISATILEKDNKIWMEKECPKHGHFKDLIYSDAKLYKKIYQLGAKDVSRLENPLKHNPECNLNCGLCNNHESRACLTNIDLTNKCNLNCPICFANANKQGYVYELTMEQAKDCLENIKKTNSPQKTNVVQFSGGEPTVHPRFLEIVKMAKDLGFKHIQIASNGIKLANSLEFAKKCKEAGLHTVYLQFDGTNDELYEKIRGLPLFETKKKAIENARKTGLKIILVPTMVKTINDKEVGRILNFAIENSDVVSGISFQPVSFCGRINEKERLKQRYTLSDMAIDLEKQTGKVKAYEDFYPLSITAYFSKFYSAMLGYQTINISCHSDCGIGTYLIINKKTKESIPITKIIDVEKFMYELKDLMDNNHKAPRAFLLLKFFYLLKKNFKYENSPKSLTPLSIMREIAATVKHAKRGPEWTMLLVAGMHFQDKYDFNFDRIKKCVIHYSTPDGFIYPFCTYNSGPTYRKLVEAKFSRKI